MSCEQIFVALSLTRNTSHLVSFFVTPHFLCMQHIEVKVFYFTTTIWQNHQLFFSSSSSDLCAEWKLFDGEFFCPQTLHFCVLILALLLINSSMLKSLSMQPLKLFPAVRACVCTCPRRHTHTHMHAQV